MVFLELRSLGTTPAPWKQPLSKDLLFSVYWKGLEDRRHGGVSILQCETFLSSQFPVKQDHGDFAVVVDDDDRVRCSL